jgi:hypothetical protein
MNLKDENETSLAEFQKRWIGQGYPEDSPPWEVLLIPRQSVGQTILLFKWHHAIADGLNMIHFMNLLMDSKVSSPPLEPEDSFIDMVCEYLYMILLNMLNFYYLTYYYKINISEISNF